MRRLSLSFNNRYLRAQSMVELLVAIVFLGAGGLAIYTGAIRSVSEAEWGAERVMCEGLVNDLAHYYGTYEYSSLPTAKGVKQVSSGTLEEILRGADAVTTPTSEMQDLEKIEALAPDCRPVMPAPATSNVEATTLSPDPDKAPPPNEANLIDKEWREVRAALGIKRMVFFRDGAPPGGGSLICVVKWKSLSGPAITVHRQLIKFKRL